MALLSFADSTPRAYTGSRRATPPPYFNNGRDIPGGLRDALSALAAAVRSPDSPLALAALSRSADTLLIDAQAASRAIALIRR
jgi:hypothetical protein